MSEDRHTSLAEEIGNSLTENTISWADSVGIFVQSFWKDCRSYEDRMMNNLPIFQHPEETYRKIDVLDTDVSIQRNVSSGKHSIHEICITNTLPSDTEGIDIVLVHGYAAALGFFCTNLEGLSSIPGSRLHAIDLLGFGCSSRPDFPIPNRNDDSTSHMKKVMNAEAFFVDAFETWRIKRGIKKCVIVSHSLGAYLMSCYYLKYGREVVEKLVLVSPVGVEDNDMSLYNKFNPKKKGEDREDSNEYYFEDDEEESTEDDEEEEVESSGYSSGIGERTKINIDKEYRVAKRQGVDLTKELTDHIHDHDHHNHHHQHEGVDSDTESIFSVTSENDVHPTRVEELMKQIKTRVQPGKILTRMWEMNYTPIQIVRWFGPFAGKVVAIWVYNRFSRVENTQLLYDICMYTTRIFIERGSGEYCLGSILAPGSLGRLPLLTRIPKQVKVPVLILYGEVDWMDKNAGYSLCKAINASGGSAKFRIVPDAGHHLYVDNGAEFERQVLSFIQKQ